ncbi:hypothetical protein GE09DRAFT_1064284 [Coniochaeta sp. 2T2.1]|nr:hypothetical protein GE09DRAFT_1064284 [Coniochaeta sp. 2T2.1]
MPPSQLDNNGKDCRTTAPVNDRRTDKPHLERTMTEGYHLVSGWPGYTTFNLGDTLGTSALHIADNVLFSEAFIEVTTGRLTLASQPTAASYCVGTVHNSFELDRVSMIASTIGSRQVASWDPVFCVFVHHHGTFQSLTAPDHSLRHITTRRAALIQQPTKISPKPKPNSPSRQRSRRMRVHKHCELALAQAKVDNNATRSYLTPPFRLPAGNNRQQLC